jgi:hypothetical protein
MELILDANELAAMVTLPDPLPDTIRVTFPEDGSGDIFQTIQRSNAGDPGHGTLFPQFILGDALIKIEKIVAQLRYLDEINYVIDGVVPEGGVITLIKMNDEDEEGYDEEDGDDEAEYEDEEDDAEDAEEIRQEAE